MITLDTIFWTQVASLFTFVVSLFVLYRVLVKVKEATIQLLTEKNAYLRDQLTDAKSQSPDVLAKTLSDRVGFLNTELERLAKDKSSTKEQLDAREAELEQFRGLSQRLFYAIEHDTLTGVFNPSAFFSHARIKLDSAQRNKNQLAFLVFDLDSFKKINDIHGHAVGHKLLVATAERLKKIIRKNDLLARLGGDEFASVIEYIDLDTLQSKLLELVEAISMPFLIDDKKICISTSIGVSLYPQHGSSAEELLRISDEAMYRAKQQGKGKYVIFS